MSIINDILLLQDKHIQYLPQYLSKKVENIDLVMDRITAFIGQFRPGIEQHFHENHYCNAQLWSYEDRARDLQATDETIANVKRSIDKFNQRRNDAVEKMNVAILTDIAKMNLDTPLFSETPGSILDRLSIMELKKFHTLLHLSEEELSDDLTQRLNNQKAALELQVKDLRKSLTYLLEQCAHGTMHFREYKQYKMYNDPNLNPYLKQQA